MAAGGGGGEGRSGHFLLASDSDLGRVVIKAAGGESEEEFVRGIDDWLQLCRALQGMNAHRCISVGEHVPFDDHSWQYAFQLMRDFIDVQSLVLEGLRQKVAEQVAPATVVAPSERQAGVSADAGKISMEPLCQYACRTLWDWCKQTIKDEGIRCLRSIEHVDRLVKKHQKSADAVEVSFHLPLHRFMVACWMEVLRHCRERDVDMAAEFAELFRLSCGGREQQATAAWEEDDASGLREAGFLNPRHAMLLLLIEYPLKILAAVAESQASLWVREQSPIIPRKEPRVSRTETC